MHLRILGQVVATAVVGSGGAWARGRAPGSAARGACAAWARCLSLKGGAGPGVPHRPIKCVIFDKDGTLISFHHTWSPWADGLIGRVVDSCAVHVQDQVRDKHFDAAQVQQLIAKSRGNAREQVAATLGYNLESRRVFSEKSLLAWAAQPLIREALEICLAKRLGLSPPVAAAIAKECWHECDGKEEVVALSTNTPALFARLRERGIKIAVCTSDARAPTESNLATLGLSSLVDKVVCGDDATNVPKPAPDNILNICKHFQLSPEETVMVGDTNADLKMALAAHAGLSVAVLSGVGSLEDLSPNAHVVLQSIDELESVLGE
jgi:phosphoglycolate phosphatase